MRSLTNTSQKPGPEQISPKHKCVILRGKTTEVIEEIQDAELDFAYIDGDHTLKGITIDLHRVYPKIKPGGWIGGDDFSQTIWQHATRYEPTLVFPYAVYFAEAVGAQIYALPHNQFLLKKAEPPTPNLTAGNQSAFEFNDLTKSYQDTGLKSQFNPDEILKRKLAESNPFGKLWRRIVNLNRRDQ